MEVNDQKMEEKASISWSSDPSCFLSNAIYQDKPNTSDPFVVHKQSQKRLCDEFNQMKDTLKNMKDKLNNIYDSYTDTSLKPFTPESYLFMNHTTEQIVVLLHATKEFITFINDIFSKFEYQYNIQPIQFSNIFFTEEEWIDFSKDFKVTFGKSFPYSKKLSESPTDESEIESYISMISSYVQAYDQRYRLGQCLLQKLSNGKKIVGEPSSLNHAKISSEVILSNKTLHKTIPIIQPLLLDGLDDSYYYLSNDWNEDAKETGLHICILYDEIQMVTIVIRGESCKWVSLLINEFTGFIMIKEYTSIIESVANSFYDYFNLRPVIDFDDAKKKVDSYEILNDIDYSKKDNKIERDIHTYLVSNYTISGDIKKMMKSCVLQDRIETALLSTPLGNSPMIQEAVADTLTFRKTMSAILLNMGLKKKRMKDGIYYYGIEPKDTHEKIMTTELDVLMRVRELQSKTGTKKDLSLFKISGVGLNSVDTCLKSFSTPLSSS